MPSKKVATFLGYENIVYFLLCFIPGIFIGDFIIIFAGSFIDIFIVVFSIVYEK